MLGITILAVFIIFFRFSIALSRWLTYRLKWPLAVVFFTRIAIVIGVAHLMVIDEHIGKHQIDRLCKSHGLRNTDLSKAYGKSVIRNVVGGIRVKNMAMPTIEYKTTILDAKTNEKLAEFSNYLPSGGWLARHTFIGLGNGHPILETYFDYQIIGCQTFSEQEAIFSRNKIAIIPSLDYQKGSL